jgi:pimeloyl-ACP methyl ester carboxylesterase
MRMSARYARVQGEPGLAEVTLTNTGSGWQEKFLLFVPVLAVGERAPVLVVFHRFGVSHWDAYYFTSFFEEARRRGWFVIAPLSATQKSFSSLESQINVQAALNFTANAYNVDRTKVYGVGFSMGGGAVTSYAARHLDPSSLMFAAIVNHTGGVSLANTWANEYDDNDLDDNVPSPGMNLEVPDILENWYGGPPTAHPFNYQRCSAIDLDPQTEAIAVGSDMSRNLSHIPVRNWMANNDPMVYLRDQTTAFDTHVQGQNANNTFTQVNASVHKWETMDFANACDWLAQFSLQTPTASSTLADQNGRYFYFDVEQGVTGAFTPFSWIVDPIANRLTVYATANLSRISVDVTQTGLVYNGTLKLNVNTADGTGDQVRFLNVPQQPTSVTRDGAAASGTWDPMANTFVVNESTNTTHLWRLNF